MCKIHVYSAAQPRFFFVLVIRCTSEPMHLLWCSWPQGCSVRMPLPSPRRCTHDACCISPYRCTGARFRGISINRVAAPMAYTSGSGVARPRRSRVAVQSVARWRASGPIRSPCSSLPGHTRRTTSSSCAFTRLQTGSLDWLHVGRRRPCVISYSEWVTTSATSVRVLRGSGSTTTNSSACMTSRATANDC